MPKLKTLKWDFWGNLSSKVLPDRSTLTSQKLVENAKNWKTEMRLLVNLSSKVLPDRSTLTIKKLVENAKIAKLKWDICHFGWSPNTVPDIKLPTNRLYFFQHFFVYFVNYWLWISIFFRPTGGSYRPLFNASSKVPGAAALLREASSTGTSTARLSKRQTSKSLLGWSLVENFSISNTKF